MAKTRMKRAYCLNCKQNIAITDNYCSNCGQENHDVNLPISHFFMEVIEGLLHFDTKFFHTVKAMFLAPGKITLEYNEGKRMQYVPPARLYIFVSVIYFFAAGFALKINSGPGINFSTTLTNNEGTKVSSTVLTEQYTEKDISLITQANSIQLDSILISKKYQPGWMNRLALKQAGLIKIDPKYHIHLTEKVLKSISISLFFLMPIFALFLQLLFFKQNKLYVQHLIFSIHAHTMFFFILLLSQLIYISIKYSVLSWALIAALVYLLASMKQVYSNSWGRIFLKFILLLIMYFAITTGALIISLISGATMI
ncbi:MAG TPA: DUF3667 domain-containing protein [Bacteroidia bacterium]|nr:DUF3667 domain-containing protein [Bacteroidia bacterium]